MNKYQDNQFKSEFVKLYKKYFLRNIHEIKIYDNMLQIQFYDKNEFDIDIIHVKYCELETLLLMLSFFYHNEMKIFLTNENDIKESIYVLSNIKNVKKNDFKLLGAKENDIVQITNLKKHNDPNYINFVIYI